MGHGSRTTTILAVGAVERTPTRTTAALLIAVVVEHDPRQLELTFDARERPTLRPPVRVSHAIEAELVDASNAATGRRAA